MTSDILVNVTPMETRVALVENGAVQEIFLERNQTRGLVGNIYKGKVVRVLPGMQAAFIDIGLERAAFIHASDIDHDRVDNEPHKPIQTLVREGQALVVQVIKDPMGTKGARLTTALSIPSRYLVFMPGSNHIGVSQRIDGEAERDRLRKTVTEMKALEEIEKGGFILRTAAEGIGEFEIRSDMNYLKRVFRVLQERMKDNIPTTVIYEDLPLYLRVARDLVRADTEKIRIDSKETFGKVQDF
ncbi:MAG: ribonuclease E/G, partial [Reinekea forsetii]|nr:ribonuclease E/G [Reinekea forsetii]